MKMYLLLPSIANNASNDIHRQSLTAYNIIEGFKDLASILDARISFIQ